MAPVSDQIQLQTFKTWLGVGYSSWDNLSCGNEAKLIFFSLLLSAILSISALAQSSVWVSGVKDMKSAAINHPNEIGRFFFKSRFSNGKTSEIWGVRVEGTEMRLLPDFAQAGKLLKDIAHRKPSSFIGCFLHTHPRKIYLALQKKSKDELIESKLKGLEELAATGVTLAPPGMSDISLELGFEEEFEEYGLKIPVQKSLGAMDSLGVWYFDYFKEKKERDDFLRRLNFSSSEIKQFEKNKPDLNEVRVPLMIAVSKNRVEARKITGLEGYRQLLLAYAMEDVSMRFVPYGDEVDSSPCGFR